MVLRLRWPPFCKLPVEVPVGIEETSSVFFEPEFVERIAAAAVVIVITNIAIIPIIAYLPKKVFQIIFTAICILNLFLILSAI